MPAAACVELPRPHPQCWCRYCEYLLVCITGSCVGQGIHRGVGRESWKGFLCLQAWCWAWYVLPRHSLIYPVLSAVDTGCYNLYSPNKHCINTSCDHLAPLVKAQQRNVVLFTHAKEPVPAFFVYLYCHSMLVLVVFTDLQVSHYACSVTTSADKTVRSKCNKCRSEFKATCRHTSSWFRVNKVDRLSCKTQPWPVYIHMSSR